jgi:hypothetical protein
VSPECASENLSLQKHSAMKWLVTIFYVNCQHESSHVLVHGLWLDKLGSILGNGVSRLFPTKPGDPLTDWQMVVFLWTSKWRNTEAGSSIEN